MSMLPPLVPSLAACVLIASVPALAGAGEEGLEVLADSLIEEDLLGTARGVGSRRLTGVGGRAISATQAFEDLAGATARSQARLRSASWLAKRRASFRMCPPVHGMLVALCSRTYTKPTPRTHPRRWNRAARSRRGIGTSGGVSVRKAESFIPRGSGNFVRSRTSKKSLILPSIGEDRKTHLPVRLGVFDPGVCPRVRSRLSYAPPQNRKKRWLEEAPMEGWFSRSREEPRRYEIAEHRG